MIRPSFFAGLLLACSVLAATPAQAWGPLGHRLVARLAEPVLSPQARAEVQRLLAIEGHTSLADIANWADGLRESDPDLGRKSARWHYVNIGELDCRYDADAACSRGDCVVEAIRTQAAILGDRRRSDAERVQALKFVVHFVGDVHQPLHAGNARDRGGNTIQVQHKGRGTNLHAIWDTPVLASSRRSEDRLVRDLQLDPRHLPADTGPITPTAPAVWAEQSCRLAVAPGVVPAKAAIDDAYLQQHRPAAERQVRLAGARLAAVLGAALD